MFYICTALMSTCIILQSTLILGSMKGQPARVEDEIKSSVGHPLQLTALVGFPIVAPVEPGTDPNDGMDESSTFTLRNQQKLNEQTQFKEPTNALSGDMEISTVSSSSHSHFPPSKQSHYSSIPSSTYFYYGFIIHTYDYYMCAYSYVHEVYNYL